MLDFNNVFPFYRRIADLEDKICDMEDEKRDMQKTKEALEVRTTGLTTTLVVL